MGKNLLFQKLKQLGFGEKELFGALESKKAEAKNIVEDASKTDKIVNSALKLCDKLKNLPMVGDFFGDVPLACMMVSDWVHKKYREVPLASIITIVAALVYLVSPIDLIPDVMPMLGILDDAAVIGMALRAVHADIMDYANWKAEQEE